MWFWGLLVGILALGLAALVLIFGFKLFKIFLPIIGFVVGIAVGAGGVTLVLGHGLFATLLSWVIAIIVGIVFALLAYFIYAAFIVLLGASLGAGLFAWVTLAIGFNPGFFVTLMGIIGAIIFGIITIVLRLEKYIIIVWTSFAGASMAVFGLMLVINRIQLDDLPSGAAFDYMIANSWFWMLIWIVVAAFGITIQAIINQGQRLDPKELEPGF